MEKLRKILFPLAICLLTNCLGLEIKAQNNDSIMYKLIGLMDFNQGPIRIPEDSEEENRITFFFARDSVAFEEFKRGLTTSNLSLKDFEFRKIKTFDGESGPNIYSKKYKPVFDDFFHFKFKFISYQKDEDNGYNVYGLELKKSKFKTLDQKLNFLNGLFIRYGSITEENIYQLKINSNQHNLTIILKFLKDSGSEITEFKKNSRERTPGTNLISFVPSSELKQLLAKKETK